jgi:hypothetical protein
VCPSPSQSDSAPICSIFVSRWSPLPPSPIQKDDLASTVEPPTGHVAAGCTQLPLIAVNVAPDTSYPLQFVLISRLAAPDAGSQTALTSAAATTAANSLPLIPLE